MMECALTFTIREIVRIGWKTLSVVRRSCCHKVTLETQLRDVLNFSKSKSSHTWTSTHESLKRFVLSLQLAENDLLVSN